VFSGMLAATMLAVLFVPTLYVITQKIAERLRTTRPAHMPANSEVEA
jgi:hypothetical protein